MSLYARDSGVANSAIVVNVGPDDFGTHPLDGVAFQREWERKLINWVVQTLMHQLKR